jgi:DNA-binding XRE family transcriptional regulator
MWPCFLDQAAVAVDTGHMASFDHHAVATARASAGMSQRELARAVGVSRATIQNTESRASTPSADIVARIAEATRWPINAFFTSESEGRDASTAKQRVAANRTEDTMTRHHGQGQ